MGDVRRSRERGVEWGYCIPCSTDQGSSREGAAAVASVSDAFAVFVVGLEERASPMRDEEAVEVWAARRACSMVGKKLGL